MNDRSWPTATCRLSSAYNRCEHELKASVSGLGTQLVSIGRAYFGCRTIPRRRSDGKRLVWREMKNGKDQQMQTEMEARLAELWDREQIKACLHRYCRGVDRFDKDMILSAFHPDCLDEHGKFVGTPEEFVSWALGQHGAAHQSHQHCLLNHMAEIEGDTAHAETYFMFVSMNKAGKPVTIGGGRYIDRLEKRVGDWRIAARVTLRDWSLMDEIADMSDLTSFTSTRALLSVAERVFMNQGRGPARDRSDPSYDRPLQVDPARREGYLHLVGKV